MTAWVIRADGDRGEGGELEAPEYLHTWEIGPHREIREVQWTAEQRLAHRFDNRNHASEMCTRENVGDYAENIRPVQLVPVSRFDVCVVMSGADWCTRCSRKTVGCAIVHRPTQAQQKETKR